MASNIEPSVKHVKDMVAEFEAISVRSDLIALGFKREFKGRCTSPVVCAPLVLGIPPHSSCAGATPLAHALCTCFMLCDVNI